MSKVKHSSHEITKLLREWGDGSHEALEQLMPLVYDELHRQAARFLRRERPNHTLQTTGLIHETYIKLVEQRNANWESRTHFFAIAAQAMRRILIDHARARHQEKRGGANENLPLDAAAFVVGDDKKIDLIALDEALNKLFRRDAQQARVVELKFFGGLSLEEISEALKISRSTVARDWEAARAWLWREMSK